MDSRQIAFLTLIFSVATFCLISFFNVLPADFVQPDLHPRRWHHDVRRVFVRKKRLHAQDCPPLWRSYMESYRSASYNKVTNIANMESVDYNKTTSPNYTTVAILNKKPVYNLCDVLVVQIQARDWTNQTKTYGGDFFRLKLYELRPYSATAENDILDFGNGTYLAFFTLRWTGKVRVQIKLIHPAELLPQMSLTLSGKVGLNITFAGQFINGNISEEVICRYVEFPGPICNLSDPNTHGPWFCQKPKNTQLECKHWRFHKMYKGTFLKLPDNLTPLSKSLLKKSHMIEIMNTYSIDVIDKEPKEPPVPLPYCAMDGLPQGIHSSGYFFRNSWYPDHCRVVAFNIADGMKCLRHKNVVILGDSTSRQMYEYFRDVYKKYFTQRTLPKGVTKIQGPLELVNKEYHANIKYHFHGLPSSGTGLVLKADTIEFIANRLNSKRDGCDVIYIICLWAHFLATGKAFYVERMLAIKHAVQGFLDRCPGSKVIFKGANTKDHPAMWIAVVSSEWNIVQHELALRELFKDERRVGFINAFDITKVHPYQDSVHPNRAIVKEIVNRMLTYICKG